VKRSDETMTETTRHADPWAIVFGLFALGNLGIGGWMLVDPVHWYFTLPAGVPDFGPLNEHFVRDVGCAFMVQGALLGGGALVRAWRVPACAAVALFYVLHAAVHVIDTTRGLVGPEHWLIDVPGVYVPALILVSMTWLVWRGKG
jgi:hypothetical protein